MERRKHERFSVSMNATLVHDKGMPIGCRVRDVSEGGLLIQCEQCQHNAPFSDGDQLNIRLSLKDGDERKVIPLPVTVRRVMENGIAAEFTQPQAHLLKRLEPDFLDRKTSIKLAAVSGETVSESSSTSEIRDADSLSRERRKSAIRRARAQFAAAYNTAEKPAQDEPAPTPPEQKDTDKAPFFSKSEVRLASLGILTLITAIGLVAFSNSGSEHQDMRIAELESATRQHDNRLADVSNRIKRVEQQAQQLEVLDARVETLVTSMAALEPVRLEPENAPESASNVEAAEPDVAAPPPSASEPSKATQTPPPAENSGPWVVNLVSLNNKEAAGRFTKKALDAGIPAVNNEIIRDGQTLWRVQIEGFASREAAVEYADKNKQTLGLNSVWVYKQ